MADRDIKVGDSVASHRPYSSIPLIERVVRETKTQWVTDRDTRIRKNTACSGSGYSVRAWRKAAPSDWTARARASHIAFIEDTDLRLLTSAEIYDIVQIIRKSDKQGDPA